MNHHNMIWFGRYEGWLRMLAHGVKDGDAECIKKAARLFDLMLPDRCVVIPMPAHTGEARQMLDVANAIPGNRYVVNALTCDPHEPCYIQKKLGTAPYEFEMHLNKRRLKHIPKEDYNGGFYIIDNCIATGVTAAAARVAVGAAGIPSTVCAIAYSPWR